MCYSSYLFVSSALSVTLAQLEHEHAVSVGRRCDEVTEELQLQQNSTADQMDLMVTKAKLESDVSHLKETQVWPLTQTFNSLLFCTLSGFFPVWAVIIFLSENENFYADFGPLNLSLLYR